MTNEAITKFEEDIKNGRDVSIESYIVNTNQDYTSNLTRTTNKVSIKVNYYLKKMVEGVFKVMSNFVED